MSPPRRIVLGSTVVLALVLAVASLAWACAGPTFGVPATFMLSSAEAPAGSTLTAEGNGWLGGAQIRWDSKEGALLASPVGPDFAEPITIPRAATAGTHDVVAVPARGGPPMTASVFVTRSADPPAGLPALPAPTQQPSPPASGGSSTTSGASASRAKAVAMCKKRYNPRRARTTSKKRRLAKKRAACIRRAKKRLPSSRTSSFSSPISPLFG